MSYVTRLMRVSSKDRLGPESPTTDFATSFGNRGSMTLKISGISVEHVSFPNFIQNVPPSYTAMTVIVTGHPNLGDATVDVVFPSGQYNVNDFVDALNAAFDAAGLSAGGVAGIIFTVVNMQSEGITENIEMSFPGYGPGGTVMFSGEHRRLQRIIGIPPTDVNGNALFQVDDGNVLFRSNLGGESVVYLHSKKFTAGHEGIAGTANQALGSFPFTALTSIPVDVPFGFFVHQNNGADTTRPIIVWNNPADIDLSSDVDFSLRDHHGGVVDLGTGELQITLRLWVVN